eukprot:TRINITY_DN10921_c0_g1_i1.p1 TRINITY_DN10921_c0_g1~~TRINITY_DN10921_c0_g1_i1.p1  ORF type:complete len:2078 (-),score=353.73 TRINITY_DN10921_c0_g1_i1:276-6317(-)
MHDCTSNASAARCPREMGISSISDGRDGAVSDGCVVDGFQRAAVVAARARSRTGGARLSSDCGTRCDSVSRSMSTPLRQLRPSGRSPKRLPADVLARFEDTVLSRPQHQLPPKATPAVHSENTQRLLRARKVTAMRGVFEALSSQKAQSHEVTFDGTSLAVAREGRGHTELVREDINKSVAKGMSRRRKRSSHHQLVSAPNEFQARSDQVAFADRVRIQSRNMDKLTERETRKFADVDVFCNHQTERNKGRNDCEGDGEESQEAKQRETIEHLDISSGTPKISSSKSLPNFWSAPDHSLRDCEFHVISSPPLTPRTNQGKKRFKDRLVKARWAGNGQSVTSSGMALEDAVRHSLTQVDDKEGLETFSPSCEFHVISSPLSSPEESGAETNLVAQVGETTVETARSQNARESNDANNALAIASLRNSAVRAFCWSFSADKIRRAFSHWRAYICPGRLSRFSSLIHATETHQKHDTPTTPLGLESRLACPLVDSRLDDTPAMSGCCELLAVEPEKEQAIEAIATREVLVVGEAKTAEKARVTSDTGKPQKAFDVPCYEEAVHMQLVRDATTATATAQADLGALLAQVCVFEENLDILTFDIDGAMHVNRVVVGGIATDLGQVEAGERSEHEDEVDGFIEVAVGVCEEAVTTVAATSGGLGGAGSAVSDESHSVAKAETTEVNMPATGHIAQRFSVVKDALAAGAKDFTIDGKLCRTADVTIEPADMLGQEKVDANHHSGIPEMLVDGGSNSGDVGCVATLGIEGVFASCSLRTINAETAGDVVVEGDFAHGGTTEQTSHTFNGKVVDGPSVDDNASKSIVPRGKASDTNKMTRETSDENLMVEVSMVTDIAGQKNDEEFACADGIEVLHPSETLVDTGLSQGLNPIIAAIAGVVADSGDVMEVTCDTWSDRTSEGSVAVDFKGEPEQTSVTSNASVAEAANTTGDAVKEADKTQKNLADCSVKQSSDSSDVGNSKAAGMTYVVESCQIGVAVALESELVPMLHAVNPASRNDAENIAREADERSLADLKDLIGEIEQCLACQKPCNNTDKHAIASISNKASDDAEMIEVAAAGDDELQQAPSFFHVSGMDKGKVLRRTVVVDTAHTHALNVDVAVAKIAAEIHDEVDVACDVGIAEDSGVFAAIATGGIEATEGNGSERTLDISVRDTQASRGTSTTINEIEETVWSFANCSCDVEVASETYDCVAERDDILIEIDFDAESDRVLVFAHDTSDAMSDIITPEPCEAFVVKIESIPGRTESAPFLDHFDATHTEFTGSVAEEPEIEQHLACGNESEQRSFSISLDHAIAPSNTKGTEHVKMIEVAAADASELAQTVRTGDVSGIGAGRVFAPCKSLESSEADKTMVVDTAHINAHDVLDVAIAKTATEIHDDVDVACDIGIVEDSGVFAAIATGGSEATEGNGSERTLDISVRDTQASRGTSKTIHEIEETVGSFANCNWDVEVASENYDSVAERDQILIEIDFDAESDRVLVFAHDTSDAMSDIITPVPCEASVAKIESIPGGTGSAPFLEHFDATHTEFTEFTGSVAEEPEIEQHLACGNESERRSFSTGLDHAIASSNTKGTGNIEMIEVAAADASELAQTVRIGDASGLGDGRVFAPCESLGSSEADKTMVVDTAHTNAPDVLDVVSKTVTEMRNLTEDCDTELTKISEILVAVAFDKTAGEPTEGKSAGTDRSENTFDGKDTVAADVTVVKAVEHEKRGEAVAGVEDLAPSIRVRDTETASQTCAPAEKLEQEEIGMAHCNTIEKVLRVARDVILADAGEATQETTDSSVTDTNVVGSMSTYTHTSIGLGAIDVHRESAIDTSPADVVSNSGSISVSEIGAQLTPAATPRRRTRPCLGGQKGSRPAIPLNRLSVVQGGLANGGGGIARHRQLLKEDSYSHVHHLPTGFGNELGQRWAAGLRTTAALSLPAKAMPRAFMPVQLTRRTDTLMQKMGSSGSRVSEAASLSSPPVIDLSVGAGRHRSKQSVAERIQRLDVVGWDSSTTCPKRFPW